MIRLVRSARESEERLERLERLASTDDLTGLPNRRHWDEHLPRELGRSLRQDEPICVAMLDLDRFKAYNDAHGHQAGDRLLKEVAAAWRAVLRPYDLLARYGGEEFSLTLMGCEIETRPGSPSACGRNPGRRLVLGRDSRNGIATRRRRPWSAGPIRRFTRPSARGRNRTVAHEPLAPRSGGLRTGAGRDPSHLVHPMCTAGPHGRRRCSPSCSVLSRRRAARCAGAAAPSGRSSVSPASRGSALRRRARRRSRGWTSLVGGAVRGSARGRSCPRSSSVLDRPLRVTRPRAIAKRVPPELLAGVIVPVPRGAVASTVARLRSRRGDRVGLASQTGCGVEVPASLARAAPGRSAAGGAIGRPAARSRGVRAPEACAAGRRCAHHRRHASCVRGRASIGRRGAGHRADLRPLRIHRWGVGGPARRGVAWEPQPRKGVSVRIEVRGRNTEVTEELRDHVEKRFARIGKQVSALAVLEVELMEERNPVDRRQPGGRGHPAPQARHPARPRGLARDAALHPRDRRGPAPPGQEASRQAPQAQRDSQADVAASPPPGLSNSGDILRFASASCSAGRSVAHAP